MNYDIHFINQALLIFIKENLVAQNVLIDIDTPLESLGLDSFSIIEIVLFIERKFGLELPDGTLTKENVHSVATLSACVHRNLPTK